MLLGPFTAAQQPEISLSVTALPAYALRTTIRHLARTQSQKQDKREQKRQGDQISPIRRSRLPYTAGQDFRVMFHNIH
jgi:hypothetical protein